MRANLTPVIAHPAVLNCHPETSSSRRNLEGRVGWTESGALRVTFTIKGDIAFLRIPQSRMSSRAEGLWKHTCFEAFVGVKGDVAYYEFNFSTSGEWAVYVFRDYRDGGPMDNDELDPKISVRSETETLELSAVMRLDLLPVIQPGAILRLGLSAVIEDIDGQLSYWALKHPPGKPDFHHSDNFTLEIQPLVDGVSAIAYTGKP
jgi:hypothetical protein